MHGQSSFKCTYMPGRTSRDWQGDTYINSKIRMWVTYVCPLSLHNVWPCCFSTFFSVSWQCMWLRMIYAWRHQTNLQKCDHISTNLYHLRRKAYIFASRHKREAPRRIKLLFSGSAAAIVRTFFKAITGMSRDNGRPAGLRLVTWAYHRVAKGLTWFSRGEGCFRKPRKCSNLSMCAFSEGCFCWEL